MAKKYKISCAIGPDLIKRLNTTLATIRKNPVKGIHADELSERIVELSSVLMNYYFLESVLRLHTNPILIKMTKLGISTGIGMVNKISHKLIGNLESSKLLDFVAHLESLIEES